MNETTDDDLRQLDRDLAELMGWRWVKYAMLDGRTITHLEDDPPPKASAPASRNGHAGAPPARTTTRRLNYVPPADESEREIREQLTAAANRRLP